MKEGVTTLPGSLGVNPPEWTTAHKNVPPDWLHQEGHPCMIAGRHGSMEIVNGRLICVVSPKPSPSPKESTDMYGVIEAGKNPLADLPIHQQLNHAVTRYDQRQQNSKRGHYNPHALGLYLGAAERAHDDIKGGKSVVDAINTHFNGSLANHIHKTLGTGARYKEDNDMSTGVISEAVTLRFSSPSRTQLAKAATYFGLGRATGGLGNIKVHTIEGVEGNWYFEITSNEDNQFLDPTKMNGIIPTEVTVTKTVGPPKTAQTASQDKIRKAILEMVEERMNEARQS